ncbi:MAG TPA: 50S ribosomal protein L34e [Candidatus Nanoarchaeia archaeon]|nr:50S ribosomal protein L34e [Candidatus Nanoarchaeia archaeon]
MPQPRYKSHSKRRITLRTPGGRLVVHYKKRKPNKAQCRICGNDLKGVPRVRATALKRIPLTKKRPERPYGGNLCSPCMRNVMIERARNLPWTSEQSA